LPFKTSSLQLRPNPESGKNHAYPIIIHPAVLYMSATLSSLADLADLMYPPSPRGFDNEAGSVTCISLLGADDIVRVL
jgi:hypothetical protein